MSILSYTLLSCTGIRYFIYLFSSIVKSQGKKNAEKHDADISIGAYHQTLYVPFNDEIHETEIFINTELLASTIIMEWETCYAMKMMMSRGECVRIISI